MLVVVLQGAFIVAAAIGAVGLGTEQVPWRRVVAGALVVVAAAVPLGGFAWWLADDPAIADGIDTDIPVYMVQSSEEGPEHGILVIRGSVEDGLTYTVRRGDGVTLGEDEVLNLTARGPRLHRRRARPGLAADDRRSSTTSAPSGIEYVVLPSPADGDVACGARRHHRSGAGQRRGADHPRLAGRPARWTPAPSRGRCRGCGSCCSSLQGVGVVVVAVLCLPTTNPRRSAS